MFERGRSRKPIQPTGSPRDLFLHIKPSKLDEAYGFLNKKLGSKALIIKTEDALKQNLFGFGKPDKEFLSRAGNLMILPYKNNMIWWLFEENNRRRFKWHGLHGGLNEEEMFVPFAVAWLSDLAK